MLVNDVTVVVKIVLLLTLWKSHGKVTEKLLNNDNNKVNPCFKDLFLKFQDLKDKCVRLLPQVSSKLTIKQTNISEYNLYNFNHFEDYYYESIKVTAV